MKKPLKILYVVLSAIVVILIVVVVAVYLFAGSALKIGIETAGTKALSVAVNVDDVDLSILGGSLGLKNLVIDNPPGYQHDKLLELGNARVAVDIRSLLSDTVNIKQIKLDGMNVVLEQRGVTSNNLQDVIKAIPKTEPKPDEPAAQPGKKLRIDELEITNVTVKAKLLPVPGKTDTVTLKLKPIRMTDLGTDNKLDTAKLSGKILLAIATGVAEQGAGLLPDDMTSAMKDTLSKTAELGKTAAEEGKKILEEGKGVLEGFKGLLKKKD
jgi:uncharacterized protein involved in outer membrane biogenesis